jgi:hypothetical protein
MGKMKGKEAFNCSNHAAIGTWYCKCYDKGERKKGTLTHSNK